MTTCQVCGTETDDDNLILLEGRRVCPACKPLVVQQLKEGCLPPMEVPIDVADHEFQCWELIKTTWSICRQDWMAIVGLQLLVAIPSEIVQSFYAAGDAADLRQTMFSLRVSQFLDMLIGVVAVLGTAWVVNERVVGHSLSFAGALGKAMRRWLPGIGTHFLMGLVVGLLMLLLIVPGIIFLVYYTFAIYVVALRGCAGTTALGYSKNLVKGRWWRVLGRTVGLCLPPVIPVILIAVAGMLLPQNRLLDISTSVVDDVLLAFIQVGTALLFVNLDALERKAPLGEVVLGEKRQELPGT